MKRTRSKVEVASFPKHLEIRFFVLVLALPMRLDLPEK